MSRHREENHPMRPAIHTLAVAWALSAAPALAQLPAEVLACVEVPRDADRLACFDAAMLKAAPQSRARAEARAAETARINAAEASAAAAAAAAAAKARADAAAVAAEESFGAQGMASRGADRNAPPPGELQAIESRLAEILVNQSGLGVFLLENGQLWRQVDTSRRPNIRVGDPVTISRAAMGGYHLNFVKQKGWVLVKRVR
jgi:hypothetical protein